MGNGRLFAFIVILLLGAACLDIPSQCAVIREKGGDAERTTAGPPAPLPLPPADDLGATGAVTFPLPPEPDSRPADAAQPLPSAAQPFPATQPATVPAALPPAATSAAAAATQPAAQQPAQQRFIVRTIPVLDAADLQPLMDELSARGFHPAAREEQSSLGAFLFLELGVFNDASAAAPLLVYLRNEGFPVFIQSAAAAREQADALIPPSLAAYLFPETLSGTLDRLELVMEIAQSRLPPEARSPAPSAPLPAESPYAPAPGEYLDRLALLAEAARSLPPPAAHPPAAPTPETTPRAPDRLELIAKAARSHPPTPPTADRLPPAPAAKSLPSAPPPILFDYVRPADMTLRSRLRDLAWELREKGYRVYVEGEDDVSREGVLVGVFDDRSDAVELAREMNSYGYAVRVLRESAGDGSYFVYVHTEGAPEGGAAEILRAERSTLDDAVNYLMNLRER
ncbi:MAG: hypothetical protein AB1742_14460 [bacterium]